MKDPILHEEDGTVPVNNVGSGNIAAAGIGPQGDIALGDPARKRYRDENLNNANYASENIKRAPKSTHHHALQMIRRILGNKLKGIVSPDEL